MTRMKEAEQKRAKEAKNLLGGAVLQDEGTMVGHRLRRGRGRKERCLANLKAAEYAAV